MWALVVVGIWVHFILIFSIFDVYYTSPIVRGIPPRPDISLEAPAKRIVVISADGLRYDTFNRNPDKSTFLHSIIRNRLGVSGLSQSHVPTESRPGHVAIFAGFTEDISAVAKGWKKNPVDFDNVFNRSSETWMWGSPDIIDLFDNVPQVHSYTYSSHEEDFASDDASKLDTWVFDKFEDFLTKAKSDVELSKKLFSNRLIFFLHLLGLDTNGHGNKPHSHQYIDNIRVVDEGINRTQKLINEFFADERTAWVFTGDHGMTDWGSHGSGSNEEVFTPFVAWGAGIRKGATRIAISQIDITPLISSLIGAAVPVNSMGVLPVHAMDADPQFTFRAVLSNFHQLKAQVTALRNQKSHRMWFKQYEEFNDKSMSALEEEMLKLARARRHSAATSLFVDNAHALKSAIIYYHRYDRSFLGAAVSMLFIAWIILVITVLYSCPENTKINSILLTPGKYFCGVLLGLLLFCLYCQFSVTQTIYVILPAYLFSLVENIGKVSQQFKQSWVDMNNKENPEYSLDWVAKPLLALITFSVIICLFVLTFVDRRFLSLIFVFLMGVPYCYHPLVTTQWKLRWRLVCLTLLPFPFFPPVGVATFPLVCVAAPLLLAFALSKMSAWNPRISSFLRPTTRLLYFTAVFILVAHYVFDRPPPWARLLSWISIPTTLMFPIALAPSFVVDRLLLFCGALFVPFSLLSISYESLFTLLFLPLVALFVRFEFGHLSDVAFLQLSAALPAVQEPTIPSGRQKLSFIETRRAVICVAFVLSSLFGTGNFASINSFNPSTLNLFISVFSPFTMAILLILKLLIPILMTSIAMAAVVRCDPNAIKRLCCMVLVITDFMSLCFFHQLRDDGSWLDIGMSISQYIVSMCISVAMLVLLFIASALLTFDIRSFKWHSFLQSSLFSLLNSKDDLKHGSP